jgi:[ribosomal protein S5]-alanine N-acetyltransferase
VDAVFQTDRLTFRLPERGEATEIAAFYATNWDHLQPWSPTLHPVLAREAFWRDEVDRRRLEFEAGRDARGFLWTRAEEPQLVGNLSLTNISRGAFHACTLGYALAAIAQRRGYMQEAVRGSVTYAFGTLRLHRVMAGYVPRNRRSAAVLRRAGFTVEGYARDYLLINGHWEDHILTAITNPDWDE